MAIAKTVWVFIEQRDLSLMRRIHRWRAPRWIRFWMVAMTRLGDGLLWYILALLLLGFGGQRGSHAFIVGGVAALTAIVIFRKMKLLSRRPRPYQIGPHCWTIITPPDQYSFPSGHAMTSFAIAASIGHLYPDFQVWLLLSALSVATSRIILGMHFLTDVVIGALVGVGLGFLSLWLFTWFRFIPS